MRDDAVARDAFAQNRVDRDTAGDAGFHGEIDVGLMARSQISAPQSAISSLLAVTMDLPLAMAPSMISLRDGRAADEFGDDIDFGMRDNLAPVSRAQGIAGAFVRASGSDGAAADRSDAQTESQFQRDLVGIGGQDSERTRAHITETDHTNVNVSHILGFVVKRYHNLVGGTGSYFCVRRGWLRLLPLAVAARLMPAQTPGVSNPHAQDQMPVPGVPDDAHLPNGKLQRDEILKLDYEQNLKDARNMIDLAKSFELELEKSDRFVLSLALLKKLDDMDRLTKRIRNRMRH